MSKYTRGFEVAILEIGSLSGKDVEQKVTLDIGRELRAGGYWSYSSGAGYRNQELSEILLPSTILVGQRELGSLVFSHVELSRSFQSFRACVIFSRRHICYHSYRSVLYHTPSTATVHDICRVMYIIHYVLHVRRQRAKRRDFLIHFILFLFLSSFLCTTCTNM